MDFLKTGKQTEEIFCITSSNYGWKHKLMEFLSIGD